MAVDPNGNLVDIGIATSNSDGHYSYTWSPPMQGEYTIYASFTGSNAYYASQDSTALDVSAATTSTSTPQPAQAATDYSITIIGTGIGIAIAVIIAVAIATVLILRKR